MRNQIELLIFSGTGDLEEGEEITQVCDNTP